MKLADLFAQNTYVLTSEVGPIKGCVRDAAAPQSVRFLAEADLVKEHVHAVNVTDNQSSTMRLGSLAGSVKLKERGIEPIYQITCRDRNRIALQSELLSACSLGISNVLIVTGDYTTLGDHAGAKPVFDLDSVQLIRVATGMTYGYDMMGNQLSQPPDFSVGAVVNPNFEPLELQLMKMEKKIDAGAQFFQTQPVYDVERFEKFIRKAEGFGVPVQMGLVLIKSAKMAAYMNAHVSGIDVPESWIKALDGVSDNDLQKKCVEMNVTHLQKVGPMCQGIHFMPMGWSELVPEIIREGLNGVVTR